MRLVAFRPRIPRHRIFHRYFAEIAKAQELPNYLDDWQQALDTMKPGFTIFSDMTDLLVVSVHLHGLIEPAQQLLEGRSLRMIVSV